MLIDVFLFCKEFDILEIRLQELSEIVDKFVLVEAGHTFSDKSKPYYWDTCKDERFDIFRKKILSIKIPNSYHNTLSDVNRKDTHWIERVDRNYAMGYLKKIIKPEDIILLADVDEIPSKEYLTSIKETNDVKPINIKTKLFRYYLNLYFQEWRCTQVMSVKYLQKLNWDWDNIRRHKHRNIPVTQSSHGWHFTHVGSPEEIFEKTRQNCSHKTWEREKFDTVKSISDLIKNRYHRPHVGDEKKRGQFISISELPIYVQSNTSRFSHILGKIKV